MFKIAYITINLLPMLKPLPGSLQKQAAIIKKNPCNISHPELHQLAFNNSFQANIISSVVSGKIISANPAACALLEYGPEEILTKKYPAIFKIKAPLFISMLRQQTAEGRAKALVTAIQKGGNTITCEITSALFTDENDVEMVITTLSDRSESILQQQVDDTAKDKIVAENIVLAKSRQKTITAKREKVVSKNIIVALAKADARQTKNDEWIQHMATTSYDVMWDWDIHTGSIYVGESIKEVFGYTFSNNTLSFAGLAKYFMPGELLRVRKKLNRTLASGEKNWKDAYRLKRHDGSAAFTTTRAIIIRDKTGKAVRLLGAIQDISRVRELQKKLKEQFVLQEEQDDKFRLAVNLSVDIIWDWDLSTNEVNVSEGFEELFGYTLKNHQLDINSWSNYLHPDDKSIVETRLRKAIASSALHWEQAYRFIKADGSIATVFGRGSIMRHADGKAYRVIGAMQDLTKQKVLGEQLEQEINLKERQIADAMQDAKETERSDIGKELHDNVNQLLGASQLYLDMAKQGGTDSAMYICRSSEYTFSAIEEIRKLSKTLTTDTLKNLGLKEAIDHIARDTMEVNPIKISCAIKGFSEDRITEKFKLNIFRIVQEQLNNILKHAKAKNAAIQLSQNKTSLTLSISDNEIGFDIAAQQDGIGITNIISRATAYQGSADFVSQPGKGCMLTATFPITEDILNKD